MNRASSLKLTAALLLAAGLAVAGTVVLRRRVSRPDPVQELEARARAGKASPGELVRLGGYLLERGDALRAAEMAFRARKADPQSAEANHLLGVLYVAAHDDLKARAAFREAVRLAPNSIVARLSLAQFEVDHRHPEAALEQTQAAVNLDHNNASAWLLAGKVQRLAHGDTAAGASFRRAVSLDPSLTDAYVELGTLALDFDNYAEAVPPLENAYRLGDRRPATLACLALAHVAGPGADADAARAGQLLRDAGNPENPPAWFAEGLLAQRQQQLPQAKAAFVKVLRANPRNERAQYALAMVLREQHDLPGAERAMRRHDELVTQRQQLRQLSQRAAKGEHSPVFLREYGRALLEADQPEEAARQFRAWATAAPGDAEAARWLQRAQSAGGAGGKR